MIIYCLSYAHDIMIWITRSSDLHSDNIITTMSHYRIPVPEIINIEIINIETTNSDVD